MTMSGVTLSDYFTFQNIQGGKKAGGAVSFIVMGHGSAPASFQWQTRLCAIQCLNLTFLVNTEHQCFLRGVEIETHNVGQFLQKMRVTG